MGPIQRCNKPRDGWDWDVEVSALSPSSKSRAFGTWWRRKRLEAGWFPLIRKGKGHLHRELCRTGKDVDIKTRHLRSLRNKTCRASLLPRCMRPRLPAQPEAAAVLRSRILISLMEHRSNVHGRLWNLKLKTGSGCFETRGSRDKGRTRRDVKAGGGLCLFPEETHLGSCHRPAGRLRLVFTLQHAIDLNGGAHSRPVWWPGRSIIGISGPFGGPMRHGSSLSHTFAWVRG